MVVHQECRRKYCHPNSQRVVQSNEQQISSPNTRKSCQNRFDFQTNCLFCGTDAKYKDRKKGYDVFPVRTLEFQSSIKDICKKRCDDWSKIVLGRIEFAQDLPAIEARYHQTCCSNFRSGYQIPLCKKELLEPSKSKKGRPTNVLADHAFSEVIKYFETDANEQMSLSDLVSEMEKLCGTEAYSSVYMKKKLLEHFGDSIMISEVNGKPNIVTFKSTAHGILHSFYHRNGNNDCESETKAIIETAAKLILNDIKSLEKSLEEYPTPSDIMCKDTNRQFVPNSLELFLKLIIDNKSSELKTLSIGQAIVQSSRPRGIISPLQIGLGVQMHHQFGSRFLIDTLSSLGFCSTYQEVQRFERSAAASHGTNIEIIKGQFIQFVADNVDHNIGTLDGHDTFHGMGIVTAVTPKVELKKVIPRCLVTTDDLAAIGNINIHFYRQQSNNMDMMAFRKMAEIADDPYEAFDFLIKVARPLKVQAPSWSGFMQMVRNGSYPGQSSVVMMPMIDLNPSDMSCIYSTLKFVAVQSSRVNSASIITFDQPLYWKALNIVTNEPESSDIKHIVVRLGAFHTQMSFLGSIGRLMENTGLAELLATVYAPNTVGNMLSGKAVSRAIRGHFLVDDALNTILLEQFLPTVQDINTDINNNSEGEAIENDYRTVKESHTLHAKDILEAILENHMNPEAITKDTTLFEMYQTLQNAKSRLADESRTAKLWLQYMDMIDILKKFITAERTGLWKDHCESMQKMLPFFAASGHNLYLKSGYMYLQHMFDLHQTHPSVYRAFCEGHHVIRRSDRFWGGLSSDLIIEQVLMRSVKSVGGMTRGRGMSEAQRSQWLLSMPACADMNNAMQDFTGQKYLSSEQHKDCSEARMNRDEKDREIFLEFLRERNPFSNQQCLRNIETGAVAETNVNVDEAKQIGHNILTEMTEKFVQNYTFKRNQQAITLGTKTSIKVGGDDMQVDPQLLFQRLLTVADDSVDKVEEVFSYELSGHPSSLFDSSGLLREAQKPALATAIWELGECGATEIPLNNICYVLDGGSLVQRLPWRYGSTFHDICNQYVVLVQSNYGRAHIVFDGYINGPSTKDVTHERRRKGVIGTKVNFDAKTPFKTKKEIFLSNHENKQNFINLLGTYLINKECLVTNASDDADLQIVQTAIMKANEKTTVVIGEDTDVLVLLCYHADETKEDIFYRSDIKTGIKKKKVWDIKKTKAVLDSDTCRRLLFIHAFSGCDTTSRLYGIGKGVLLKKVITDTHFQKQADIFLANSTHDEIEEAGEQALICLYNGILNEGVDTLRYKKFVHKANTGTTMVQVQTLPPTKAAAKFHSFRVYLQIQNWIGKELSPLSWGWRKKDLDTKLVPIQTSLPAAPERLLKVIRCCCRINCDTKRCTCRKHGLSCSTCCAECKGTDCSNAHIIDNETQTLQ